MMPAAWLSTINPADAAKKKTSQSRQNTRRRRPSAAGAEEDTVPDRELGQTGRGGGERGAERAGDRTAEHEDRRRGDPVDVGRQVHADTETGGREREDEGEVGPAQAEQRLQRLQE